MLQKRFVATKMVGNYFMQVGENKKLWLIPNGFLGTRVNPIIYKFSDVVSFKLIEDGETVIEIKGGLGRAIVGGILFGKTETKNIIETKSVVDKPTLNSIDELAEELETTRTGVIMKGIELVRDSVKK